ncbi:MAG: hypothetical protein IJ849_09555 [Selenomonadaceae bacterium]|nr:hypothetical protein [Selenomonadaceae bacterium]
MEPNTLNGINRNMDAQNRYVKEILDLIDECKAKELLADVSKEELEQLTEHCTNVAVAANTAKKLVKNLLPIAEKEQAAAKAEKDKEKEQAKKKKAKKEAPPSPPTTEDEVISPEDLDFLS